MAILKMSFFLLSHETRITTVRVVHVSAYLSNRQGVLRGKIARRTDERVKVMSELVNGVQVIKMYAWERPFEKLVEKLRKYVCSLSGLLVTSLITQDHLR